MLISNSRLSVPIPQGWSSGFLERQGKFVVGRSRPDQFGKVSRLRLLLLKHILIIAVGQETLNEQNRERHYNQKPPQALPGLQGKTLICRDLEWAAGGLWLPRIRSNGRENSLRVDFSQIRFAGIDIHRNPIPEVSYCSLIKAGFLQSEGGRLE